MRGNGSRGCSPEEYDDRSEFCLRVDRSRGHSRPPRLPSCIASTLHDGTTVGGQGSSTPWNRGPPYEVDLPWRTPGIWVRAWRRRLAPGLDAKRWPSDPLRERVPRRRSTTKGTRPQNQLHLRSCSYDRFIRSSRSQGPPSRLSRMPGGWWIEYVGRKLRGGQKLEAGRFATSREIVFRLLRLVGLTTLKHFNARTPIRATYPADGRLPLSRSSTCR